MMSMVLPDVDALYSEVDGDQGIGTANPRMEPIRV